MMKKITLFLIVVLSSIFASSQEHMSFKGIEMSSDGDSFVAQLESQGFEKVQQSDNSILLQGTFANYQKSFVIVLSNSQGNVYEVVVIFPPQTNWENLNLIYTNIKNNLTKKYGVCSSFSEKWDGRTPETDYSRMQMLSLGMCKYKTIWNLQQGDINLLLGHSPDCCYVELHYVDQKSLSESRQTAINDL